MASAGGDWKDMFAAAQRGDSACVAYHLSQGVDVDYQHPEAMLSALVVAASHGHVEVMQTLLDHGANPNLPAELGPQTALEAAQQGGHPAAIGLLLHYGAQWPAAPRTPWWQRWLPGL
jgi:uncharacterized protein